MDYSRNGVRVSVFPVGQVIVPDFDYDQIAAEIVQAQKIEDQNKNADDAAWGCLWIAICVFACAYWFGLWVYHRYCPPTQPTK